MQWYRCPEAPYPIDRSVHLARLAAFDPVCRTCPHRAEAADLPPSTRRAWRALEAANRLLEPMACDGAICGTLHSQVSAAVVRSHARAWGHFALGQHAQRAARIPNILEGSAGRVRVVLAGDGRPETAPLRAAACEGLCMAGCHVLELGGASAAVVAVAAAQHAAAGAIFVGNPLGAPHTAGLCFWGLHGSPAGDADVAAALADLPRDARHRGGRWQPLPAKQGYLAPFRPLYHGLRPLRFVVHTTCVALLDWIAELTRETGCSVLCHRPRLASPRWLAGELQEQGRVPLPPVWQGESATAAEDLQAAPPHAQQRAAAATTDSADTPEVDPQPYGLRTLRQLVQRSGAHFGMWCDGDGQRCYLLDERGQRIPPVWVLLCLTRMLMWRHKEASATVVLEQDCDLAVAESFDACGIRTVTVPAARSEMWQAMLQSAAVAGGGPSGRLWLASNALDVEAAPGPGALASGPRLDALAVLTLWLHVLSRTDLPASQAVQRP